MAVLGMGRRNIRLIPVDNRQHMIPEELAEAIDADLRAGLIFSSRITDSVRRASH